MGAVLAWGCFAALTMTNHRKFTRQMRLLLLTVLFALNAEISFGQNDSTKTQSTSPCTAYFLRSSGFVGSARNFSLFIDDQLVCKLTNNSYSTHTLKPGKHTFSAQLGGSSVRERTKRFELTAVAGQSYYLTVGIHEGALAATPFCEEITVNTANQRISKLKREADCL
jgi:hypothetical protein